MFKKKEKTEKAPKNKKVRTMKVGTHKKSVLLLWAVLLASTSFGVYKNFTAIDTHTVHEKEIIQLRLNDTNGIENFVKNFAKAYYSWDTSKEAIEARTTEISKYLTKELQDLNADTIRTDIPTSVTVTNVLVWNVEQSGMNDLLWSSIFVTLMANKIGGLQFGIYRNCQISSRVFHTAVAALPLTKANRSDFE